MSDFAGVNTIVFEAAAATPGSQPPLSSFDGAAALETMPLPPPPSVDDGAPRAQRRSARRSFTIGAAAEPKKYNVNVKHLDTGSVTVLSLEEDTPLKAIMDQTATELDVPRGSVLLYATESRDDDEQEPPSPLMSARSITSSASGEEATSAEMSQTRETPQRSLRTSSRDSAEDRNARDSALRRATRRASFFKCKLPRLYAKAPISERIVAKRRSSSGNPLEEADEASDRKSSCVSSLTLSDHGRKHAIWEESRRRRHSFHSFFGGKETIVMAQGRLYFYRDSSEVSMATVKPMEWMRFLAHTELCRMNFDNTQSTPLQNVQTLARIIENLKICATLKKPMGHMAGFLHDVCDKMHAVGYHTLDHIVDVTQCLYTSLLATHTAELLQPIELAAAIFAAICHDLDHPGLSNAYQNSEDTAVSRRYEKRSVLENHSLALLRELVAKHALLEHVSEADAERFHRVTETMILRTDMAHHVSLMRCVTEALATAAAHSQDLLDSPQGTELLLSVALKCADISNQARPWKIATKWNAAVYHEFWHEGDLDRERGRQVNSLHMRPLPSENLTHTARSSVGFIQFVVVPLYAKYLEMVTFCQHSHEGLAPRVIEESLKVLHHNSHRYKLTADGEHVPGELCEKRPGICGAQQLRSEQGRFARARPAPQSGCSRDSPKPPAVDATT